MGVITISLDNESEKLLRESAKLHYGERKDALSKTIIKGIKQLENSRDELKNNLIERLKTNPKKTKIKIIKEKDKY
jgi:hypothetical protein